MWVFYEGQKKKVRLFTNIMYKADSWAFSDQILVLFCTHTHTNYRKKTSLIFLVQGFSCFLAAIIMCPLQELILCFFFLVIEKKNMACGGGNITFAEKETFMI